jgi:hypothetical protein
MADDKKPPAPVAPVNRPEPPLKADPLAAPRDPATAVADPANPARTNPGPGARRVEDRERPAFRPLATGNPPVAGWRNAPNQPVVPAPSENVFPGPAGRPDPSRTPEERQATADAAIQAHAMKPGHLTTGEGAPGMGVERTSDGKPDDSQAPKPVEQ